MTVPEEQNRLGASVAAVHRLYCALLQVREVASTTTVLVWSCYGVSSPDGRTCKRLLEDCTKLVSNCEAYAAASGERLPLVQIAFELSRTSGDYLRYLLGLDSYPPGLPLEHHLLSSDVRLLDRLLHAARFRSRSVAVPGEWLWKGSPQLSAERQVSRLRALLCTRLSAEHPELGVEFARRCYNLKALGPAKVIELCRRQK